MKLGQYNLEMEELQKHKVHQKNIWTPQMTSTKKLPYWAFIISTLSKLYSVLE
jgi:hypothetical protein